MATLAYETFVAPEKPVVSADLPAGEKREMWSPTAATLIHGDRDAVLVDALMTDREGQALADWVESSGKNLTTIYITHGHGDHFFGAAPVLERFPDARLVAVPEVVDVMKQQVGPNWLDAFWRQAFPDQIGDPVVADRLDGDILQLEGEELVVVPLGHSDTDHTTALHAPSIGLVAAGDSVYNDVHLYLSEASADGLAEWFDALDTIADLNPDTVVAGHKRDGAADDPNNIEATRQYLRDWEAADRGSDDARELYNIMIDRYPNRINRAVLWHSAEAAKRSASSGPVDRH
ncbi:glyoxylase-like metal-dependent hydrolase (beta-lactamase superfamily II) [Asanoa ferruginea]|uniref:Glyoxylase-like metal-dependent hydrolase (Beta-lactamase superfamily II) n=1 Tax=Asanoa ferruginea TaxID=53367 RepID=A0A3D9ZPF7_9ACTN|nr:MBL fold metallo-hydrolase [Asanoa ferruginea]REF99256.1 glyoxylase-like metal-dependent hydrolase (beta-lactamase superfamily II) [Asanoa ferruginea]GIF45854.1 MBL fold metallo-hydrolase [Asanoa ferruginea]